MKTFVCAMKYLNIFMYYDAAYNVLIFITKLYTTLRKL